MLGESLTLEDINSLREVIQAITRRRLNTLKKNNWIKKFAHVYIQSDRFLRVLSNAVFKISKFSLDQKI